MICGEDVRENRSNDGPYVYVELVDTYGGTTYEPEAIGYSDWRDYGCHYDLPDEYARGESADYPFTDSWNWGDPVVGALVDDSYDVKVFLICVSVKVTNRLHIWPKNGMLRLSDL